MQEAEKKTIEKEITGLKAKLNWDHIPESQKLIMRLKLASLEAKLHNKDTITA